MVHLNIREEDHWLVEPGSRPVGIDFMKVIIHIMQDIMARDTITIKVMLDTHITIMVVTTADSGTMVNNMDRLDTFQKMRRMNIFTILHQAQR